ncbi:MAG: hypothetical protein ACTHJH_00645 [Marmoricola sp.]
MPEKDPHAGDVEGSTRDRLRGELDAGLMLLDRQVLDSEGRMVGKVDDVELAPAGDGDGGAGALRATGILLGPAALLPRLGGPHGGAVARLWRDLGRQRAGWAVPGWIDLGDVDRLDSGVHLHRRRQDVIVPQPHGGVGRYRLGQLLGLPVHHEGRRVGIVTDVRLDGSSPDDGNHPLLTALVVGRGRPGARLGYGRHPENGPRLISALVHAVHRHQQIVPVGDASIDWEAGRVDLARLGRGSAG